MKQRKEREKPKITILHGAFYAVMNTDLEAHGSLQTISRVFGRKLPDVMPFSRCNVITKECGDCCSSLGNQNTNYLIQDHSKVAAYMAKPEFGSLNGGCFSKQPDFSTLPNQPTAKDLFLPPLGVM